MTRKATRSAGAARSRAVPPADGTPPAFTPVPRKRLRHDGWTPQRQVDFIAALAQCGCVESAWARVGMASSSAYDLRSHPDAGSFRQVWEVALDYAVNRMTDAAFSRAINGVVTPIFFQGEQVGERRRFDDRLTMFLLRYRDPVRYGKWLDGMRSERAPDGAALTLAHAITRVAADASTAATGRTPRRRAPLATVRHLTVEEQFQCEHEAVLAEKQAARDAAARRWKNGEPSKTRW